MLNGREIPPGGAIYARRDKQTKVRVGWYAKYLGAHARGSWANSKMFNDTEAIEHAYAALIDAANR